MIKRGQKLAKGKKSDYSLFRIKKFNVVDYARSTNNHSRSKINYFYFFTLYNECCFSETILTTSSVMQITIGGTRITTLIAH